MVTAAHLCTSKSRMRLHRADSVERAESSLRPQLGRPEAYGDTVEYLRGLIADVERKNELAGRYKQTLGRGRLSTPVEVILRMLVMKCLYHWSCEDTEHFVSDSLVLHQFFRVCLVT